jgi:hypothetical protein
MLHGDVLTPYSARMNQILAHNPSQASYDSIVHEPQFN